MAEAPAEETAEEASVVEAPAEETAEEAPVEETPAEEAPKEEVKKPVVQVFGDKPMDMSNLNESVDFGEAVQIIKKVRAGKLAEVSLDDICENFEEGEEVTLETLKAKKVINARFGRVKVLASGDMTKALTVEADKFTAEAIKAIVSAGGTVKKYI